jgi:uncharacterized protein (DUF952 family)
MSYIYHIAVGEKWSAAQATGFYRAESLSVEGFIHCSNSEQITGVANELYVGQEGLVLLEIDPAKISAEIRYEDCYDTGQAFPHICGPLPIASVVRVISFSPDEDGRFDHHLPLEN